VEAPLDWPTIGGNVGRSGLNAGEGGVPPLTLAWSTHVNDQRLWSAAIVDGRVFVSSMWPYSGWWTGPNELAVYDLETGARLWRFYFGEVMSVGQPTVVDGVVYIARNKGTITPTDMFALDAATGALIWSVPFDSQWETFWAPLVVGETLYANGGTYGGLYAWDRTTGAQLFHSDVLPDGDEWSPAWDGEHVLSFVEIDLSFHDPVTGVVDRVTTMRGPRTASSMRSMPVVDEGRAFVIVPPELSAIDLASGVAEWSPRDDFAGTAAASNGQVYVVREGSLYMRDAATGRLGWRFDGDGMLHSPAVLTSDYAYVSSDSAVYALARATGALEWNADVGGRLSIGEGHLVVAGETGTLTAFALSP
jgi:outer membrane protein assembly factor BamB